MARKYDLISELYSRISKEVVSSSGNWTSFLRSACRNYRLRFDEQLLVFAQRPDATAVLEIERWNEGFGRWVNRGAHGIAVFEDSDRSRQRLLHYFDISDTHESRFARPVPIWTMKPEYTGEVIETLENTFGKLEDKSTLPAAIFSAAKNAAEDNLADYLSDFNTVGEGTDLEYLSAEEAAYLYTELVKDSIAYMLMSRLGLETERFFELDQFDGIQSFASVEAVNAVGVAASDITEMGLSEISKTIMALDRQNRIIDESTIREYNKAENKERSENHEQDRVHDAGRLQPSEPDTSRTTGGRAGALRTEAQDIPEGTPQNPVLQSSDELQADGAFGRGSEQGDGNGEQSDPSDGEIRGRDRGTQGDGYDGLGSQDEQPSEPGSGDRFVRGDIRLDYYDRSHEDRSIPFFGSDADINEILLTTPYLKDSKDVIRSYYETHRDREDQVEYIKGIFNNDYTELILSDGRRVGYKTYQNVLHLWEGSYLSRTKQAYYDWGVIAAHFEALRLLGELHDTIKPIPSLKGQLSLIETQAEPKSSAFAFSQEIIDTVLTRGSGFSEGKLRIYEQFQKSLSSADNIAFLKKEYGWGGVAPVITGTGINEQHDGKGIKLARGFREDSPSILLKWPQVEKRIGELIAADRYLNTAEKAAYPAYLAEKEERERRYQFAGRFNSLVEDFNDYETQINNDIVIIDRYTSREFSSLFGQGERVNRGYGNTPDVFVLPALREILERIIAENTHLTDRAQELLDELEETDIAKGFELTEDEKNPPPEPKKELRFSLGDKVYIGSKEFEILDLEDPVVLFDPDFPILTQDMPRDEFFQKASENPLNDKHLVVVEDEPSVDETDIEAERAINAHEAEFGADGTRVFREPEKLSVYDRTTEILYAVLRKLNMDDVGLDFEGEDIIAFDEDNQWKGKEFYHFLIDECFVFEDGGHVTGIDDELLADFTALAAYNGVLCVDNRLNKPWREYLQAKFDNQGAIILYRIGDFYEIMGDDAEKVAQSLELHLGSRSYLLDKRIPMCGFPAHKLDAYVDMLHDRGYDVVLFEDGKGERLDSPYKDNPMDTMPVARIDVLDENDEVEISTDFTDESAFLRGVFEENERGTKMRIVLYRDDNGRTIPTNFVEEMKPPYPTYEFVDSPFVLQNQEEDLVRAERLINEYCQKEFGQAAYFGDIRSVGLAYTTITDEDLEIQVTANLKEPSIDKYIAGVLVERQLFDSLREMCDFLEDLDFNDLTDYTDDQIETVREKLNPTQPIEPQAPVTPAWEKQPKNKVKTFDLHPEIPMSERHTFDLAANEIEEVGKKERFRRNLMAIQLLKKCQAENRFATPEEQQILSKYVGWGGIPEAFDENNSAWATEYLELSTVLTPDEYASARESTLTAFYTPPVVISAIYKAMEQMGFREGNILEPSCGIGHFIGMLPEEMRSSRMYGVEIDTISAGIAQQLYQRTSIAPQPFEEANIPDSFFDAVVGNVPFGDFRVSDKRYDKNKFLIHDYFFAKSLDKLRPGGVMALITSKGTMDKESPAIRKYIAQRADLIGAIRLPNNTFKGNAGTEVVSDILILQKRDRLIDIEPDWVRLDTDENGVKMNSYFVQHPEMVLGEMKMVSGRFGLESTCEPYDGADLESQLAEAVSNIHGEITDYEMDDELTEEDTSIPADPSVRNFSFTIFEDKLYFRENSRMSLVDVSATAENRIKGLIAIRDSVRALIDLQTEDYPDEYIQKEQARLNELYDAFTKKYGLINSRGNVSAFSQDSSFSLISALEVIGEDGELERKADMFFKRTIKPHTPVTSVDTASEALAVSMGEKARIDMEYMCELTGKTEKEIYQELKGVIFLNPLYGYGNEASPKYLMADEYLSGNVREKLIVAKRSAEVYPEDYTVNVGALEKVQPKDLTASEIAVRLGATWIPPEIVEQFMFEFLGTPRYAQWRIKVHYSPFTSEWNIENKSYDTSNIKVFNTYGTSRINAYKIIEESLNLKDVRIFDYIEDEEGRKKPVLNKKETQIAQAKQELIKQGFRDWIWSDAIRREKLCRLYNDKFNSLRPREYDGSHITFNGMNPEIELREHQRNAVAHILYGGNTLLAHAVGAGKSATRS